MIKNILLRALSGVFFILPSCSFAQDSICNVNTCAGFPVPLIVKDFIKNGYEKINLVTILGEKYVIVTTENEINKCAVLFPVNEVGIAKTPVNFQNNNFCNYSILDGKVISSWKDTAKWYDDIYQLNNNNWVLLFRDECVGCSVVKRIYFENSKPSATLLLSDGSDFTKRSKIFGVISVQKASLFRSANFDDKLKAYLIKGDVFDLTDMSPDGNFYKISYKMKNAKTLTAWISYDDFSLKN
mgnify:CR=1 FL=1